jgi:para-nitrobenzyl esterase
MSARRLDATCGPLLVEDDGTLVHARGIPYATAERFAAPAPAHHHTDVLDATQRGPVCPQLPSRLEPVVGAIVDGLAVSEHCQVLSVTAPSDANGLPVMVWFHGGAYVSGGGDAPKYDPDALCREGRVVVVNVTFRLGLFGYLNPIANGEGNFGLQDQLLALRWTRDNIASFGGDPARVTLFGQSAGGDSVYSLMLCEEGDGLFRRAILQSAPMGLLKGRGPMTAAMRKAVADSLSDTAPTDATVDQLLAAQTAAFAAAQPFGAVSVGGMPYAPIAGIAPMPAEEATARRLADAARRVEILVGYARDDGNAFVSLAPQAIRLRRFGPLGNVVVKRVAKTITKRAFGAPATELAAAWTANGGHAASFRVDWSPPGAPLGACHCIELPLLLGTPEAWADAPMLGSAANPIDEALARRVRGYWAGFAHDGIAALGGSSIRIAV